MERNRQTRALQGRKAGRATDATSEPKPGLATRQVATDLLGAIVHDRVSYDGLTDVRGGRPALRALDPRDQALVRAILKVALRNRNGFAALIDRQLQRPLPQNATRIHDVLHVALAQMLVLDVPVSAAVDLAVETVSRDRRLANFARLTNGILRAILRLDASDRIAVLAAAPCCAPWLEEKLTLHYGAERVARLNALMREDAPTDLTVKSDALLWAERLGGAVLAPTPSASTVRLAAGPRDVTALEGFETGDWFVQDVAATIPATLFGRPIAGLEIADVCAAPGGKTAQLVLAGANVTAFELNERRQRRLSENLSRLGLTARIAGGDARSTLEGHQFDGILLDVPCSSTGTMRRHPDVSWTKTPSDIDTLQVLQAELLLAALSALKPGGTLVYANCSLLPEEGEGVIAHALDQRSDVRIDPILPAELPGLTEAVTADGFVRTLPDMMDRVEPAVSGMDGFFAARLRRT